MKSYPSSSWYIWCSRLTFTYEPRFANCLLQQWAIIFRPCEGLLKGSLLGMYEREKDGLTPLQQFVRVLKLWYDKHLTPIFQKPAFILRKALGCNTPKLAYNGWYIVQSDFIPRSAMYLTGAWVLKMTCCEGSVWKSPYGLCSWSLLSKGVLCLCSYLNISNKNAIWWFLLTL